MSPTARDTAEEGALPMSKGFQPPTKRLAAGLSGVPQTLLWTLHNRAGEASRPDGILRDPWSISIRDTVDFDYERHFGKSEPSHAIRAIAFDERIVDFLERNPGGVVVNLGEGLETQRFRIDRRSSLWISVDLPESMQVRERFIQPTEHHWHIACSALDSVWMDAIPAGRPVIVTAQGLLMYFTPDQVADLLRRIGDRFPGAEFVFDTIPQWLSRKTLRGWRRTKHYVTPPMPWGADRDRIEEILRGWDARMEHVDLIPYRFPRGPLRHLFPIMGGLPILRNLPPQMVRVRWSGTAH